MRNNKDCLCVKENIINIFLVVLFFLYGLLYPRINLAQVCFTAGALLLVLVYKSKNKKNEIDLVVVALTAVMSLKAMHDLPYNIPHEGYALVAPILIYLLGRALVRTNSEKANSRVLVTYIALAIGLYIQGLIDFLNNYVTNTNSTEIWPSIFWGMPIARTAYEFNFILMTALISLAIIRWKNNKVVSIVICSANIVLQVFVIKTEGRYNTFMLLMVIVLTCFMVLLNQWKYINKKGQRIAKYILVGLGMLIVVMLVCYKLNIGGLNDLYHHSYLSGSGGIFHNVRFELIKEGWHQLLLNPQGGFTVTISERYTNYNTHCMWLEYGREFGIVAFVMIMVAEVIMLKDVIRLLFLKEEMAVKVLLVAGFVCLNIFYTMEPVASIADNSQLWLVGLFVSGMIRQKCSLPK